MQEAARAVAQTPARELVSGAFIIGAPGTYISDAADRLVIGNRPGVLHYSIAIVVPACCLVLLWLLRHESLWLGGGIFLLFGIPSVLVALNSQRYEVTAGRVAMRGKAAGFRAHRDWPLAGDSAVRIGTRIDRNMDTLSWWTHYQAQILTPQGWIGIGESADRDKALEFAARLARAAGVSVAANN